MGGLPHISATLAVVVALSASGCSRSAIAQADFDISRETRLLVVAPHPDDESIAAAGLIRRVANEGGDVRVVVVTSGDGFAEGVEQGEKIRQPTAADFRGYGKVREHESVAAMKTLGVQPQHVTFLGFPDQGLCLLASGYLSSRRPFESPFTDRTNPPPDEQVIRGTRYRGVDVERELRQLILEFAPTMILMPHPEDEHPDHCAAYVFTSEALQTLTLQRGGHRRVLHYLVHYQQWPIDIASEITPGLKPPMGFATDQGKWLSFDLRDDEAAAKKTALGTYTTQMAVIGPFLTAFARRNELFLEGKPAPAECWCDAEHVATDVPPSKRRRHRPHPSPTTR